MPVSMCGPSKEAVFHPPQLEGFWKRFLKQWDTSPLVVPTLALTSTHPIWHSSCDLTYTPYPTSCTLHHEGGEICSFEASYWLSKRLRWPIYWVHCLASKLWFQSNLCFSIKLSGFAFLKHGLWTPPLPFTRQKMPWGRRTTRPLWFNMLCPRSKIKYQGLCRGVKD